MKFGSFFGRISSFYKNLALIVLNTIIVLLVMNWLASGIIDYQNYLRKKADSGKSRYSFKKYEEPLKEMFPNLAKRDIEELLDDTRHISQSFEPYTQFKEKPFAGKSVNVDSQGFRPIKDQGPWPPNPDFINIFVFGGSTTFGYGVPDGDTIPSYLQELLSSKYPGRIKVYNFGRGGYISVQERILLEKMILRDIVPDIAVFIDGLNDLAHEDDRPAHTKELTKFMDEGEKSPLTKCIAQMPIFKLITGSHTKTEHVQDDDSKRSITDLLRRYKINMEMIQSTSSHFKIKTLFVWQPVPVYKCGHEYNFFSNFDYDGYVPSLKVGYQEMVKVFPSGEFGDNFLWLADVQEGLNKSLYVDAIHYTPYLCRLIAQRIADKLEEQKMIKDVSVNR
jgi:lysophospholipase L1-like esterase